MLPIGVTEEKNANSKSGIVVEHLKVESSESKNDFETEFDKANKKNTDTEDISERIIDDANKYFLVKILSPQLTKNEDRKRGHKDKLIRMIQMFMLFQFIILIGLVYGTITMIFVFHGLGKSICLDYIETIIKFISIYITSVVIELIAMLKYIVTNVFDTSITGLVELYKDTTKETTN